eukprot:scaffold5825_cov130-Isochrysis_galbana.AAC.4
MSVSVTSSSVAQSAGVARSPVELTIPDGVNGLCSRLSCHAAHAGRGQAGDGYTPYVYGANHACSTHCSNARGEREAGRQGGRGRC